MKSYLSICPLILTIALTACQSTPPQEVLELPPSSLADRQIQTRRFDNVSEAELLAACAGVLQDLGFNLDEAEAPLGLIVASKHRNADVPGRTQAVWFLDVFLDIEIAVDREQRIRASLVTQPVSGEHRSYFVRVTFQRIVWNTDNEVSKRELLNEPELYQQFFDRLSKSVFLEANSI